jgi:hypothetical protein
MRKEIADDWIEHGFARIKGQADPRPYVMRFVRPHELDHLYELHLLVVSRLHHPHAFRPDDRSFMQQQIERRGRTVGVFCDDAIVAYAAVSFPGNDPDNLGRDLPLPEAELRHVANYEGSAVHPNCRGNKFQKLMTNVRHRYALLHDRYHILGTVSPFNPVSLQNFLELGCRVKNIKQKYGGMLRLIIYRDLRDAVPPAFDPCTFIDIPLGNVDLNINLLRRGFEGLRVVLGAGEPSLRYGLPHACRGRSPSVQAAAF